MNISRTFFYGILLSFLFGSCASQPEPTAGRDDVQPVVPAPATASIQAPAKVSDETDPAVPRSNGSEESVVSTPVVETASTETPAETAVPEKVPALPPGERILYYYPEPQDIFIPAAPVPAPAAVTSAKPAAAKTPAPAVTAAPVPPAAPKAVVPAPAVKVETVPAEKNPEAALPGIWDAEIIPVAAAEKIPPVPPSRKTTLAAGQTLEVWYPGSGWVYLGDSSAQNGLAYETRKLDKTDTLFTFKALKSGNYILDFSRFDLLEDAFSADSLAVEVSDSASKRTERIRAPNYRDAVTAPASSGSSAVPKETSTAGRSVVSGISDEPGLTITGSSTGSTGISPVTAGARTPSVAAAAPIDADAALALAKKALGANDPATALEQLDRFFSAAVSALDEGWFLRGQAYESNGAGRDIRKALAAYETLVSAYPESARWKEADARIRYIKQFYLRIR